MQKVINVLALTSFAVSASIVGGSAYVYLNKDALIESAKAAATKAATEAVAGALPGMIDSAMPKLPGATGGAIPSVGEKSGLGMPGF
jgi:hypothetical protein|tara:strand:- start:886 stop:1146 length:261 start_codon:yes stop_codon:yes gene_type:complete